MERLNRADAAAARGLKLRELADRPSQRSADWSNRWAGGGACPTPSLRSRIIVERAATQPANTERFEGFASVTDTPYVMYDMFGEYDEVVKGGAFEQTLSANPDVPLVLDHTSSRRIARTGNASSPLQLSETEGGLLTIAPTLQLSDPDVAYIVPKLESGLMDEMSFRFMIDEGRWSEDFTTFTIQRVDINRGDVSIVGYGASPHTAGSGLRAAAPVIDLAAIQLAKARSLDGDRKYSRLG